MMLNPQRDADCAQQPLPKSPVLFESGRPKEVAHGAMREVTASELAAYTEHGWALHAVLYRDVHVADGHEVPQKFATLRVPVYLVRYDEESLVARMSKERDDAVQGARQSRMAESKLQYDIKKHEEQCRQLAQQLEDAKTVANSAVDLKNRIERDLAVVRRERGVLRDELGHSKADEILRKKLGTQGAT